MILCGNNTVYYGLSIFIQVVFVFSFLVLFYFLYVIDVERKDFQDQINLLVDNLFSNVKDQVNEIIKVNPEKISKEDFELLVYGIIDTLEEKISIDSKDTIKQINTNNEALKNSVYKILIGIMVLCVIIIIFLRCYPVSTILKESVITVFFIAMVELVFLTFISGKYISADPNKVKMLLGTSIKEWIQQNNKITK
jgi:hypothetical protein